ncbi:hypothetical protein ACFU7Y_25330, partial [Kitasatospora sp. NPDC057542]
APAGATAAGSGGLPGGGQGAPGPFGAPGAPAVPYAPVTPQAPAARTTDVAGPGAAGVGGAVRTDAPANGGLPVGAEIPGLPGAVVVPRPVLPRMYELSGSPTVDHGTAALPDNGPGGGPDGEPGTPRVLPRRARNVVRGAEEQQ